MFEKLTQLQSCQLTNFHLECSLEVVNLRFGGDFAAYLNFQGDCKLNSEDVSEDLMVAQLLSGEESMGFKYPLALGDTVQHALENLDKRINDVFYNGIDKEEAIRWLKKVISVKFEIKDSSGKLTMGDKVISEWYSS